jgi:hypothetical protein
LFGKLFFGEPVTMSASSGIGFIAFGAFLIVMNGPSTTKDVSVDEFAQIFQNGLVIAYFFCLLIILIVLAVFARDNLYGAIGLASLGAGNSIIVSKALSIFVKISITTSNQFANVLPYAMALFMGACLVMQVHCLNRALEKEKSYIVNSLYFVMLTTMSVLNATVLYGEMMVLTHVGRLLFAAGVISVMNGVYQLSMNTERMQVDEERVALLPHRVSNADAIGGQDFQGLD